MRIGTSWVLNLADRSQQIGKAQRFVDSEVLRRSDPFVPFRTGSLKRSGIVATRIGSGVVQYNAVYARRQYFMGKSTGKRGRKWAKRMWMTNKKDIIAKAKNILKGG